MNRRALWLACTALTALAAPTAAQAQTAWDGSSSTDWFDATNWSAGVPTGGTSVTMDTVSPNPTVISGGAAQSFLGLIGNAPASTGQVTVTGAGSSWTNVNTLWIGQAANGTLNIQNGGTVTTATGSIGNLGGGVGTVTVTGAGSTFTNTTLVVGDFVGNGTLNILNGGAVNSVSGFISNSNATGAVTIEGAGSRWTNTGILVNRGSIAVSNGATLTNGGFAVLSGQFGLIATATVDGAGSSWFNNAMAITVGSNGSATLTISNGGTVTSAGGNITNGQVTVTDAASRWFTQDLVVGPGGTGALNIQNGGKVFSDSGTIADSIGTTGQVTVTGADSSWRTAEEIFVGNSGTGSLNILNGGVVSNFGAVGVIVGNFNGSTGTVTVSGAGSTLSIARSLLLGGQGFVGGTGIVTIQNGGVISTPQVNIAPSAASVGTLNIGAAVGAAPAAPGTLDAPSVGFGAGTGQIVFNHTATNYTFAPLIGGLGTVLVEAGTTSLTANSTYSGNTTVNGGRLLVNGSIANSDTTVNAGGTLGGAGIVGNTTINDGTLAPGNSIGTLNVQGSLTFTAASTYLVEVDPSGADRTSVTGTATLGSATVSAIYANGSYVSRRYTILNASGGVSGTFNSLVNTNLPANFTPSLSYDANNAYLDLHMAVLNAPGLNDNQTNVANALVNSFNAAGSIPIAFGALTPQGLTQVSGEAATGTQQTTFNAMDSFMNVMTDPFMGTRAGGAPQGGAAGYADEYDALAYAARRRGRTAAERDAFAAIVTKAPPRAAFAPRWSVWGAGYGGTQATDGDGTVGSNDYTSRIYGGAAGFDYRLAPDTLIGFSLGGAGTKYNLANGLGGGRSEMFQAGIYGRHHFGPAYLAGALAYGWQDVTTNRVALLNTYRASFDANAFSGRLEGGYRFTTGMGGLTPYAAGQFTTFFLPEYAEQTVAGVNTFALSYAGKDVTASRSEFGLRGDTSFALSDAIVTLRGRAAWAHNFNTDRNVSAIFQTLPASGFVVNGAAQARDSALVSAGAEAKWLNGFSVAATFEGEFSNRTESYAGKGIVRYQW